MPREVQIDTNRKLQRVPEFLIPRRPNCAHLAGQSMSDCATSLSLEPISLSSATQTKQSSASASGMAADASSNNMPKSCKIDAACWRCSFSRSQARRCAHRHRHDCESAKRRRLRTAREITVSIYSPHPARSPSRGEEDPVNYFSNGPKVYTDPKRVASQPADPAFRCPASGFDRLG